MNPAALKVLLIEDDPEHAMIISRFIRRAPDAAIEIDHQGTLKNGLLSLDQDAFDAILLDLRLPDSDIQNTLPATIRVSRDIPIVVLSTLEDRDLAVRSVQGGAQDYLCKASISSEMLMRSIFAAIERKHVEVRLRELLKQKDSLSELGQKALQSENLPVVFGEALGAIRKALAIDHVDFAFTQESWWSPETGPWMGGQSDRVDEPRRGLFIVANLSQPQSWQVASSWALQGYQSAVFLFVAGDSEGTPYAVVSVLSKASRIFSSDEQTFLQAVGHTLTACILRTKLEGELHKRIQELDLAHRRKDEFLATLSHELRTPLNVVNGYLELMKDIERNTVEFDQALGAIERNIKIETQLVFEILDMAQIITGRMRLNVQSFQLQEVIRSGLEAIHFAAEAKNIHVQLQLEENPVPFIGDEAKIRQAVWNLLTNAVKFTPVLGFVDVGLQIQDSVAEISVRDTGIGIAPEHIDHVFEKFWQEESGSNRSYMGLGLGLSIVRHIAELHGGTATVESKGRGYGATFTLKLPLKSCFNLVQQ